MENRYGLKDFILCVLLVVIIISQWLSMKQADRQWTEVKRLAEQIDAQTTDLTFIRRQLADGIAVASPQTPPDIPPQTKGDPSSTTLPDPFDRVLAAQQIEGYTTGDWFVDAFSAQPPNLTPLISSDAYASIIQNRVVESLAIQDPETLEYKPLLAKSWQQSEDGLTVTFQLRKNIAFSDGEQFDADDVVFTYQWLMNEAVAAPRARGYYEPIKSVTATDPYEVVFQFNEPYFESFGMAASFTPMPKHFYGKYTPEQFNQAAGLLLGTGPYRLQSADDWSPDGTPIVLVRNERYWGQPGPFDRIVFKVVADASVQLTMFKNGEVDLFGALPEQYRDLIKDEKIMAANQHFEYYNPRGGYRYIAWNQRKGGRQTLFADKRVRQAMTYMTDRQRLCDEVLLGYGTPANGPFHFLGKQADPEIEARTLDLEKAKRLLAEAGFADRDDDGVLEFQPGAAATLDLPAGTPFQFKLSYPSSSKTYQRIVLFLKDTYARAGVAMEPDPSDWPIMVQKLNNREFDAISLGWTSGFEVDIQQMFHSSQIADNADNFMSYSNPELDKLIDEARRTIDEETRMPLWHACHRILYEDQPYTFLNRSKSLAFIDRRIQNVQRTRAGLNYVSLWVYPIEWFVPAAQWKWTATK